MGNEKIRTCHYTTVIAMVGKDIEETFEYTLTGAVSNNVRGNNGFGFDEIFETDTKLTLAELTTEEKLKLSPRTKALKKLEQYINESI